jgi:LysM repeat protein
MNRRDMIIITVLLNVALLSALLALAISDKDEESVMADASVAAEKPTATFTAAVDKPNPIKTAAVSYIPVGGEEELDSAIRSFQANQELLVAEPTPVATQTGKEEQNFVEVTVKKGDVLEKIAKMNRTSIAAIQQANGLKSEKLSVGQRLRIPVIKDKLVESDRLLLPTPVMPAIHEQESDIYVVKSGDNPWKIARQFHVKFEDLLKLNGLDEEKARNLRAGQRLRVR